VKRIGCLLCHLAVLLAAWRGCHSSSGFLLNGVAVALLLDWYFLRLLPWRGPTNWLREIAVRAAYFVLGATAFYLARPGIVPWWEAAYRGVLVSVSAFLVERLVALLIRQGRRWPWEVCLCGGLAGLVGLLVPLAVALHPLHTVPRRSPAAQGLAFEDVRIRTADGILLAGWLVPHPHARANVLFCHGHGRNRGHLAGLLPTVHDLGLNVLAFDFRGHGDSPGHTSTFGHREVEDLRAAHAWLQRRFPDKPILLVGVSLGAAVSLQALPDLEGVAGVWSEGAFSRLGPVVQHTFRCLPGVVSHSLVSLYRTLAWLDCGFQVRWIRPIAALRRVDVPVCFCHGCKDELVPLAEGKALWAAHAGPKEHWWVKAAAHYNIRQRNREEYLRRLRDFVEGCLARGRAREGEPAQ
jgi:alpha-beta hydrolase superfamily lysophospholipase